MVTTGLVQYLLTLPAITGLVGNNIAPIPAPVAMSGYPLITYQMASQNEGYTLTSPEGLATARIVYDCMAELNPSGYTTAKSIALALKLALSGFSGTLPDGTKVWFIEIANVQDLFNDASFLSVTSVHALVTYQD